MRDVLTYSTLNHSFGMDCSSELIISKEPKENDNKTCSRMNTIGKTSYIFYHENLSPCIIFQRENH